VPEAEIAPLMTADPNDPAWKSAAVIPSLLPSIGNQPADNSPSPTLVRLLWNSNWLYIRFECTGTEVYSPFKKRNDPLYKGDVCEVFLDAKGDSRQWAEIEVSPNNVVMEQMSTLTADPKSDSNLILDGDILKKDYWVNPAWSMDGLATASRPIRTPGKASGWITDVALPAKPTLQRLGADHFSPMEMRVNILRYEYLWDKSHAKREFVPSNWSPVLNGCPHISPQAMGYLSLSSTGQATQ
jgi:hypothetical protein